MGSEAPSWADQWGAGGIGDREEADDTQTKKDDASKKKGTKGNAVIKGAEKVKNGASMGFKWIKSKCQKKTSNKNKALPSE